MKRFQFRLQKVLEYREQMEEEAKLAFAERRSERLRLEAERHGLQERIVDRLKSDASGLSGRLALELEVGKMDLAIHHIETQIEVVMVEEAQLREHWLAARQEAETMRRLRESARIEWQTEADRKEQADLDEWAVQRRTA